MTQNELILEHLSKKGPITPAEAMEQYGVYRLGARISELREQGYPIETYVSTGKTRYGKKYRVACYGLADSRSDKRRFFNAT